MFWPALAAFVALVLFGETILALFGPAFVAGYRAMVVLAGSQLLIGAVGPVSTLLNVTGHQDRTMAICAAGLVAAAALNVAMVPQYGIVGAAVSYLSVTALTAR